MTTHTLNDGCELPAIGFGTYPLRGEDGIGAVVSAIEVGYRLLDTAVNYENEREVGEAIRRSGVPRDELVVCSKLPGRHHGYDDAIASVRGSLERLGLDRLDLHLIHWPNPGRGRYVDAWRALVDLQADGLVTSIGVSNFTGEHLRRVIDETGVTPAVNQIELHPYFPQEEMRAVHADLGVLTESWSPLGKRQAPFTEPPVAAARRGARGHSRAGHPAVAGPARRGSHPQVGDPVAAAREPRRVRLRAVRRRDGGRHRAGSRRRSALRGRPRHPRGDVTQCGRRAATCTSRSTSARVAGTCSAPGR